MPSKIYVYIKKISKRLKKVTRVTQYGVNTFIQSKTAWLVWILDMRTFSLPNVSFEILLLLRQYGWQKDQKIDFFRPQ